MPFISLKTSVNLSKEKEELLRQRLGEIIEIIPGKSEEWLMIGFEDNYKLHFKGEELLKGAFINLKIFGKTTKEIYAQLTKELCSLLNEVLEIPRDKIFITYDEVENWGWNGENF